VHPRHDGGTPRAMISEAAIRKRIQRALCARSWATASPSWRGLQSEGASRQSATSDRREPDADQQPLELEARRTSGSSDPSDGCGGARKAPARKGGSRGSDEHTERPWWRRLLEG
jgi:hypothetical protein